MWRMGVMVFNATFNNISVISWRWGEIFGNVSKTTFDIYSVV
jgi:hypothetical protein